MSWKANSGMGGPGGGGGGGFRRRPHNVEEGEIGEEEGEIGEILPSSSSAPPMNAPPPPPPPRGGRFPPPPPPPPANTTNFSFRALAEAPPPNEPPSAAPPPQQQQQQQQQQPMGGGPRRGGGPPDHVFSSGPPNRRSSSFSSSFRENRDFSGGGRGGGGDYNRPGHFGGRGGGALRSSPPPRPNRNSFRSQSFGASGRGFPRDTPLPQQQQQQRGPSSFRNTDRPTFKRSNSLNIPNNNNSNAGPPLDDASGPIPPGPPPRSTSFGNRPDGPMPRSSSLGMNRNTSADSSTTDFRSSVNEDSLSSIPEGGSPPPPPRRRFTSYGSMADNAPLLPSRGGIGVPQQQQRRSTWHPRSPTEGGSGARRKMSFGPPATAAAASQQQQQQDWSWDASTSAPPRPPFKDEAARPPMYNRPPPTEDRLQDTRGIPQDNNAATTRPDEAVPPPPRQPDVAAAASVSAEPITKPMQHHYGPASSHPPPLTSSQLLAGASAPPKPASAPPVAKPPLVTTTPTVQEKKMEASPERPVETKPQAPPPPSPLTCASLGSPESVARAEKAVRQLNALVADSSTSSSVETMNEKASLPLPSKQRILKAMAGIDVKLKKSKRNVERVQSELDQAIQQEAKEQEQKRQAEERKRLQEEARKKQQQEAAAMEHSQQELERQVEEKKKQRAESKQKDLEELEARIAKFKQTEQDRAKAEVAKQVEHMSSELEAEIASVKERLAKTERAASKAQGHASKAEAEYHAKLQQATAVPELAPESSMSDIVARITAENQQRAQTAHKQTLDFFIPYTENVEPATGATLEETKRNRSDAEWNNMARLVTGKANALYTEPSENPYYEHHAKTYEQIKPLVTEHVRDKKRRIKKRWTQLAEEYVGRNEIYAKAGGSSHHKHHHPNHKALSSVGGGSTSIMGAKKKKKPEARETGITTAARASSNPYRRARRGATSSGDVVRSDYEQQQIIDQITAQEAMERRITHGASKLPRQVCDVERELTPTYINTCKSRFVPDMMEKTNEQQYIINRWSDMEKCIFLDRFLQHPKDFKKIASFLRNKSTKDCIAFYYNSKQIVPYKRALKEHTQRRKRRGDHQSWDATVHAALSVGATVTAGTSEERPVNISLPSNDMTFTTNDLHPMRLEVFENMTIDLSATEEMENNMDRKKRRRFGTVCVLDKSEDRFLRRTVSEVSLSGIGRTSSSDFDTPMSKTSSAMDLSDAGGKADVVEKPESVRKAPQKWTSEEKKRFAEAARKHGKNWELLEAAVGTKSTAQIKNYWYDCNKKQLAKQQRAESQAVIDAQSHNLARSERMGDPGEMANDASANSTPGWDSRYIGDPSKAPTPPPSIQSGNDVVMENEDPREMGGLASHGLHPAADHLWAHAQQSQMLNQQHAVAAEARRMLQQHQHQQQVMNLQSLMPWLSPTQLAQAAALQQHHHQQQHQQEREWVDAAQMHLLRQAGHHHYAVAQGSQLSNIAAMANIAAINNPGSLSGSALAQMEASAGGAPASLHQSDAERLETVRQGMLHGFGGGSGSSAAALEHLSNYLGQSAPSSTGSNSSAASQHQSSALGLFARAMGDSGGNSSDNNEGGNNTM